MAEGTLGAALEREHREIDQAIESYISGSTAGENPAEPSVVAIRALRRHIYLEEAFLFPALRDAAERAVADLLHALGIDTDSESLRGPRVAWLAPMPNSLARATST